MGFYVEQSDRSYKSGVAQEDIDAGELVTLRSDGAYRTDQSADGHFDGVADFVERGDAIVHDIDDTGGFTYKSADDDRVPIGGYDDGAYIKVRTIEDNGTDGAPSISHGDVVGVVDATAVSGTGAEFQGRIVEEGYADAVPTTFNRSNTNFLAVGRAYIPQEEGSAVTSFDVPVRVIVDKSL